MSAGSNLRSKTDATRKESRQSNLKQTINNPKLETAQHLHALIVGIGSLMGVVIAVSLIFLGYPIGQVEIGLFLGCTLIIGVGTSVGFHRYFTHRSFKASRPIHIILAILGSMAAQGPVIFWVALHRLHHEQSDKPGDPHSPNLYGNSISDRIRGLWHAHVGWTYKYAVPNAAYYAGDMIRDKTISRISRQYLLWVFIGLFIPSILGGILTQTWFGVLTGFLWGGLVRMFFWHNMVWCITSVAHVIGSRPLASGDLSTNNFWLAIPTMGESWHNNHHAFPHVAIVGFEWWQIDFSGWVIRAMEKMGWICDVKVVSSAMISAKKNLS
jgi:stearoyl-CoA desaturase (Delta-9 desaturase)